VPVARIKAGSSRGDEMNRWSVLIVE